MDRERKTVLVMAGVVALCLTILAGLVFFSLWDERQIVAWVLIGIAGALALTFMGGKVNEMSLRRKRYYHHYETPLDEESNPLVISMEAPPSQQQVIQPRDSYSEGYSAPEYRDWYR